MHFLIPDRAGLHLSEGGPDGYSPAFLPSENLGAKLLFPCRGSCPRSLGVNCWLTHLLFGGFLSDSVSPASRSETRSGSMLFDSPVALPVWIFLVWPGLPDRENLSLDSVAPFCVPVPGVGCGKRGSTSMAHCSSSPVDTGLARSALGWLPDVLARDLGAAIDPLAAYDPQTGFRADPQTGVVAFRDLVLSAFPGTGSFGINRPLEAPGRSEHKEGRAWDWRVCGECQRGSVETFLGWLLSRDAHGNEFAAARRFGIMYMIWDSRIWGSYAAEQGWRPYGGPNPHVDHVHFSFSWCGALGRTSWWRSVSEQPENPGNRGRYETR